MKVKSKSKLDRIKAKMSESILQAKVKSKSKLKLQLHRPSNSYTGYIKSSSKAGHAKSQNILNGKTKNITRDMSNVTDVSSQADLIANGSVEK